MFDGDEICLNDMVGCKQMGWYQRLMYTTACIVAVFEIAARACASGVAAGVVQTVDAEVARAAIAQAERAVSRAAAQRMLWTTADEALRSARRAFEDGDLAAAVAQARVAKEHSELAIRQKRYPPFRI
jgi:hypothetical protein